MHRVITRSQIFMIVLLLLVIFLSVTPAGHKIFTVIRDETNSFLGLDIVSIELSSELKTDEGVFPAVYTFKAYGIMKNGNITDDIRWRILSEDGSECAGGVSVLASPEYGTISITAEYPGNFVIEASCMNVKETEKIISGAFFKTQVFNEKLHEYAECVTLRSQY